MTDEAREVVSPLYKPAVRFALAGQLVVGVSARLLLDGGHAARVVGVAALAFWLATALVLARRPHAPTGADLAWVRGGFWPVLAVAACLG